MIEADGTSYRKAGAMMLINDTGQYFGLLSGGCLESNIMRQTRRCWDNQQGDIIKYDKHEEKVLAWQWGIGCCAMVNILLQPVHTNNYYLKRDAAALKLVPSSSAKYVGCLEFTDHTDRVLDIVTLTRNDMSKPLANSIGLRLGGELPEYIALSMLAEVHAGLENANGLYIIGVLNQ